MPDIRIQKVKDHYEIYVNGQFHSSEDNMQEVTEELESMEEILGYDKEN